MNSNTKQKKPNYRLRNERKAKGWTQAYVAEQLGADPNIVSRWESGERPPSPYYHQRLCELFEKNAAELGLTGQRDPSESPHASVSLFSSPLDKAGYSSSYPLEETLLSLKKGDPSAVPRSPEVLLHLHPTIDLLSHVVNTSSDQQRGMWLALEANELATCLDEQWSVEELLESLRVILQGVKAMPKITRRKLLQLSAAAMVSNVVVPEGRHPSEEDRMQLCSALGESISSGWHLFHTAGNAQVLAVSHAQLTLLQQSHTMLPSRDRSRFYSSVYNLMGSALHFQERYHEALDAHINAHVAAMGTGDPLQVVQTLICQADSYQSLGQHSHAIETIEEALRLVGNPSDEMLLRAKAQLLASWADNALTFKEWNIAEEKLEASANLIEQIQPNEQFDQASLFLLKGKYAFEKGDYSESAEHLEVALRKVSPNWIVRQVLILLPMVAAYTWEGDRDACLTTANRAFSAIKALNAPAVNKLYATSLQGLLEKFPNDTKVRTFVADKLPQTHR